jgi:hypothetical protein
MASNPPISTKFKLMPADLVILGGLLLYTVLALVSQVPGWPLFVAKNLGMVVLCLGCAFFRARAQGRVAYFILRALPIVLGFGYLYLYVERIQLVIYGHFLDAYVLQFEQWLFGVQPTVWLQRFIHPVLTEWMMFCYAAYLPMYPILCGVIYFQRGAAAMEEYLLALGVTNLLCDLCFIAFPIAGPMFVIGTQYTVPLDGWWFTNLGEFIRAKGQYPGGNLPSPHCATATIMWFMAWRYHRPSFWVLAPIVPTLYVSTFYGRFHYLSDAILGILVAVGVLVVLRKAATQTRHGLPGRDSE